MPTRLSVYLPDAEQIDKLRALAEEEAEARPQSMPVGKLGQLVIDKPKQAVKAVKKIRLRRVSLASTYTRAALESHRVNADIIQATGGEAKMVRRNSRSIRGMMGDLEGGARVEAGEEEEAEEEDNKL
jgi:hypothetical protein